MEDKRRRLCRKCNGEWNGRAVHTCDDYSGGDVIVLSDIGDSLDRQNEFLMNYDAHNQGGGGMR